MPDGVQFGLRLDFSGKRRPLRARIREVSKSHSGGVPEGGFRV
jgi:hypothetical protein